jgi:membrane fusion protein (multidrug efflux system)
LFRGRVIQVNPAANPQSRSFTVRVLLPNANLRLKPGMFGRVRFVASRIDRALTIPAEAVITSPNGERAVFIVEEDTVRRVVVTVGASRDGVAEVRSGLSESQFVVTMGHERLRDGAKVRPVTTGDKE